MEAELAVREDLGEQEAGATWSRLHSAGRPLDERQQSALSGSGSSHVHLGSNAAACCSELFMSCSLNIHVWKAPAPSSPSLRSKQDSEKMLFTFSSFIVLIFCVRAAIFGPVSLFPSYLLPLLSKWSICIVRAAEPPPQPEVMERRRGRKDRNNYRRRERSDGRGRPCHERDVETRGLRLGDGVIGEARRSRQR